MNLTEVHTKGAALSSGMQGKMVPEVVNSIFLNLRTASPRSYCEPKRMVLSLIPSAVSRLADLAGQGRKVNQGRVVFYPKAGSSSTESQHPILIHVYMSLTCCV